MLSFISFHWFSISLLITLIVAIKHVIAVDYYTEKPEFILTCRISEPNFTDCSTKSVQQLINQLVIGIPEITETFGPFDPMHVKDIQFKQNDNQVVALTVNLTEMEVKGFSKTVIKESRVSPKDYSWRTKIFIPKLRIDAKYQMKGRILLIPLNGNGKLFIEMENLEILLNTQSKLYEKGGYTFDNVTAVNVKLNMTKVRTYLDNLFNGNSKEVERSTNEFFNTNWRQLYEALKPVIIQTVENVLYDIMYRVFNLIPANFFVADIPTSEQLYGPMKN